MKAFTQGMKSYPLGWQIWMKILILVNFIIPWFFLGHAEARWALAAGLVAALTGMAYVQFFGFTRLLGLMHLSWLFLLPYLWGRLGIVGASSFLGVWLCSIIVLNGISLVIDATDVVRYIAGDRKVRSWK